MTDRDHLAIVTTDTIRPGDTLAYLHQHLLTAGDAATAEVHRATVERVSATQVRMTTGERWLRASLPLVSVWGGSSFAACAAVFDGPQADERVRAAATANHHLNRLRSMLVAASQDEVLRTRAETRRVFDDYLSAASVAWGDEAGSHLPPGAAVAR
ncbi:hypothetical protein CSPHI_04925 [Corynebacterium sphenisci DSM 44792]|uniref:Uncharacterized protein n=1 Tax=Corynebacterium sphenisci DSM 44792 TaxID=1437874 RepID=A0A1L7CXE5_9CORY|nr:hypothetical protein [Corynebacterium sphenisci]APT90488.1 hypothetical protein CSPHI_04925 [Corynebacterium sphenisci DSM 44792]